MSGQIDELIEKLRVQGARQFAAWNSEAFNNYLDGPVQNLTMQLEWREKNDVDVDSIKNLVRMIYEGVGMGWLIPHGEGQPPATFLAHVLWNLVPHQLGQVAPKNRGIVLSRIWNLAEGLAREPQWMNQFVISRTDWSTDITKLESILTSILTPVLTPLPAARWDQPLGLHVIDLHKSQEGFLPGHMGLAAPAILSIEDRCRPGLFLAIWLKKGKNSEVLGLVRQLPEYHESYDPPKIDASEDAVNVNGIKIETPLLMTPHQVLCVSSGFVVISSEDSQRLWLVEAA